MEIMYYYAKLFRILPYLDQEQTEYVCRDALRHVEQLLEILRLCANYDPTMGKYADDFVEFAKSLYEVTADAYGE